MKTKITIIILALVAGMVIDKFSGRFPEITLSDSIKVEKIVV